MQDTVVHGRVDTKLIALIERVTIEAGACDHTTRLQLVASAVANAHPEVTASEGLTAVREVWATDNDASETRVGAA